MAWCSLSHSKIIFPFQALNKNMSACPQGKFQCPPPSPSCGYLLKTQKELQPHYLFSDNLITATQGPRAGRFRGSNSPFAGRVMLHLHHSQVLNCCSVIIWELISVSWLYPGYGAATCNLIMNWLFQGLSKFIPTRSLPRFWQQQMHFLEFRPKCWCLSSQLMTFGLWEQRS